MALEYWNLERFAAVGVSGVVARTYSSLERTAGSAARSAFARSPVRWQSMSRKGISASAPGSAIRKYRRYLCGESSRVSTPLSWLAAAATEVNDFVQEPIGNTVSGVT